MKEKLCKLIIDVAGDLNENLDPPIRLDGGEDAPLYGPDGRLSSLGLVSLIIAVEQAIEEQFGVAITLADERSFSLSQSPFRNVRALADYANTLLIEHQG
jgi:D-alanine--poly(phosphoribitol) ligase subunit 2